MDSTTFQSRFLNVYYRFFTSHKCFQCIFFAFNSSTCTTEPSQIISSAWESAQLLLQSFIGGPGSDRCVVQAALCITDRVINITPSAYRTIIEINFIIYHSAAEVNHDGAPTSHQRAIVLRTYVCTPGELSSIWGGVLLLIWFIGATFYQRKWVY